MRRVVMLLVFGVVVSAGASRASAQTVTASGTVDWSALTAFKSRSAEVVFFDFFTGDRVVAPLSPSPPGASMAHYSVTLTPGDFYFVDAVVANCTGDPEACGTATAGGTHIRFGGLAIQAPEDGSPVTLDVVADPSLNPVPVCGTVTVDAGTFLKLSASIDNGSPDSPFSTGVYSTALIAAPTTSYCLLGAQFSFATLNTTTTIAQTRIPSCPAQLDVPRGNFLFFGTDPITSDVHIIVPGPPGEIRGTFAVAGFPAGSTGVDAFNSGPTIGACAGLASFSASTSVPPLSYDIVPALAGRWTVLGTALASGTTPDGVFQLVRFSTATPNGGLFTVDVNAGTPVTPLLSYTPAVVSGSVSVDSRRFGGPFAGLNSFPAFQGTLRAAQFSAAGWTNSNVIVLPMQVAERYDLYLDARGTDWTLEAADGVGYQFQFPTPNGSTSSGFGGVAALPNVGANVPFDELGNLAVLVGPVTAGGHVAIDLPPVDYRAASVTLNAVEGGASLFWFASEGRYPLPKGVLGTTGPQMLSFSFDGSPAAGRAMLPPGRFDGSTTSSDQDFNSFTENRSFDLEPDDDLTADFGAPALLSVRPIPGASGGPATVSGKAVPSDASVTKLQVLVNGACATVAADGSFSARAVIGTGPLTIVARDNLGRTTTLKRYFTTMAGLYAPCDGADLVSRNQDVNAVSNFVFQAPLPKNSFNAGRVIPLKVTGALAGVAVTGANAAAAPRVVALVKVAPGMAPATLTPPSPTVFRFDSGQWIANLSTQGLQPGTYVVQIQFWDGRVLEAAFVLV
ncbi:MAG: hypothetical protein ACJ8F1_17625 [Polyangia bacterium]